MKKFLRKLKKHFKRKGGIYLPISIVVAVVVLAIWIANVILQQEDKHKDVIATSSLTPEERYQVALEAAQNGNIPEARSRMKNLARMGESSDKPLGFGKAHLWMAKDQLKGFQSHFIWAPPYGGDVEQPILKLNDRIATVQKHLEHAVSLNPELEEAVDLLATVLIAQGARHQSVEVLIKAITHEEFPLLSLHIPLANILAMPGHDLALREYALHLFSVLGSNLNSTGDTAVSNREKYVLSSLILNRAENADIAIRRLEAKAENTDHQVGHVSFSDRVSALRMAYYYHGAISHLGEIASGKSNNYSTVINHIIRVLDINPNCLPAYKLLVYVANKDNSKLNQIKKLFKESLETNKIVDSDVKSYVSVALVEMTEGDEVGKNQILEKAIMAGNPSIDVQVGYMNLMFNRNNPDYQSIVNKSREVLASQNNNDLPEVHFILGRALFRLQEWNDAIVSLEKCLGRSGDRSVVHRMLAESYMALGQSSLAERHKKKVIQK